MICCTSVYKASISKLRENKRLWRQLSRQTRVVVHCKGHRVLLSCDTLVIVCPWQHFLYIRSKWYMEGNGAWGELSHIDEWGGAGWWLDEGEARCTLSLESHHRWGREALKGSYCLPPLPATQGRHLLHLSPKLRQRWCYRAPHVLSA